MTTAPLPIGGNVVAPKPIRRVEPKMPASFMARMGTNRSVSFSIESVITKEGCVRNIRFVSQSPFPDFNAAAATAVSQWKFRPGTLNGKPVDVIFNLTFSVSASSSR